MTARSAVPAETWRAIDNRVRERIVDMLRGAVLSHRDQAERFRDLTSPHWSETIANQHDELATIHDEALEILTGKRVRP
jgi:hypothetical protein